MKNPNLSDEERFELVKEFNAKKYGEFSVQGDAAYKGCRFFKIIDSKTIHMVEDGKIIAVLNISSDNGYGMLLEYLKQHQEAKDMPIAYSYNIYTKKLSISYNHTFVFGKTKTNKKTRNRFMSIDLNPNYLGYVIVDWCGSNKFRIVYAGVYSIKEINDMDDALSKQGIKSTDPRRKHITNKRHHEIQEICKALIEKAVYYKCKHFAMENLTIHNEDHYRGRKFNKQVNNQWCRNLFEQCITKRCKQNGIEFSKQMSDYSSFVGNFLFRHLNLLYMCLAAFEIGRRAYEYKKQFTNKKKV